jgi:hypothetical protein
MGRQRGDQSQLFYLFNLEERIPAGHLLRKINPTVTLIWAPSDRPDSLPILYCEPNNEAAIQRAVRLRDQPHFANSWILGEDENVIWNSAHSHPGDSPVKMALRSILRSSVWCPDRWSR